MKVLHVVRDKCECDRGACPTSFDYAMVTPSQWMNQAQPTFPLVVEKVFKVRRWCFVDHHHAHALLGVHGAPFRSSLVVSFDGVGNDGSFNIYRSSEEGIEQVVKLDYDFGEAYQIIAALLPEVSGVPNDKVCSEFRSKAPSLQGWTNTVKTNPFYDASVRNRTQWSLGLAGKLMGYCATGKSSLALLSRMRSYFMRVAVHHRFNNTGLYVAEPFVPNSLIAAV